ncbi:hypothetical protein T492DRAFT_1128793, partial [Pavlovales sp. CCMP2436]
ARAQTALGACFECGLGVPQDHDESPRLYRLAADKGVATAHFNLACSYRGVPQDDSAAARWYRLAAEQGHSRGQHRLAMCYYSGRGIPRDVSEGVRLFRLAAEQGQTKAQMLLCTLLLWVRVLSAAPGEAARFLAQVAQQTEDEEGRLKALALLSAHAHEPDVVKACCVGCSKTRKLKFCSKCLTARFCGAECVRRMWPVYKQSCKTFAATYQAAIVAAADDDADGHSAELAAEYRGSRAIRNRRIKKLSLIFLPFNRNFNQNLTIVCM